MIPQERAVGHRVPRHGRKAGLHAAVQRLRAGGEGSRSEPEGWWPSDSWTRRPAGIRRCVREHGAAKARLCLLTPLCVGRYSQPRLSVPRGPPSDAAKKTVFFGEFSLCLSRACLGRMII
jgi:hypothetical protein